MGRQRRTCPICQKQDLLYLSSHLRDVHGMNSTERKKWLNSSPPQTSSDPQKSITPNADKHAFSKSNGEKPWWETQSLLPFKACSSMLVCGQTGSGKSFWVYRLLRELRGMYEQVPVAILYCYSLWQPLFQEIEQNIPNITFQQGLPTLAEIDEFTEDGQHKLIICDDLMHQIVQTPSMELLFTQGCHHKNVSLIVISQNIFQPGKHSRTMALNTWYIVLFQNNRDLSHINTLGRQLYPGKGQVLVQAYQDAMKTPYSYLVVDLSPNSNPKYRMRTRIFPNEDVYVYVPLS